MTQRGSATTTVNASAEDVFRLVTDIGRLPEWNAVITRVVEPSEDLAPEREWVVELRSLGNTWRSRSAVLEYDATSRTFWRRTLLARIRNRRCAAKSASR